MQHVEPPELITGPIMLFDGECVMCNGAVNFVLKHERSPVLKFAPLQSDIGQAYLKKFGLPTREFQSFVIIDGNDFYIKSQAVRQMAKHIGGTWATLGGMTAIIPRKINDAIYDLGFRNRIRMFGRVQQCRIVPPELKPRFLAL